MRAHDRYYGEALREAESGKRRDDLWGRALAMAKGDTQAASGIYIDLLATRLESEAGSPEKIARAVEAASVVGAIGVAVGTVGVVAVQRSMPFVIVLFWLVVRVVVCWVLAIALVFGGFAIHTYMQKSVMEKQWVAAMYERLDKQVSEDELRADFESGEYNYNGVAAKYPYIISAVSRDLGYDAVSEASRLNLFEINASTGLIMVAAVFGIFFMLLACWSLIARLKKRRTKSKTTALQPMTPAR